MNTPKVVSVLLVLAGIIGVYVGGGLVFYPVELQAQSEIFISDNASQLSETRAPGAAILSASIIVLIGAFRTNWTYIALVLTALFFLSYGVGRLLSLVLDGMPAQGLLYAMIGEFLIGILALIALIKVKRTVEQ